MTLELLNTSLQAKMAMEVVAKYNQSPDNLYGDGVRAAIQRSLDETGTIELIQFTCPPIQAARLSGAEPATYIEIEADRNNFETGGRGNRLQKMVRSLESRAGVVRLKLIIGDDDEEKFIFPVLGRPTNLDQKEAERRKTLYEQSLATWIKSGYPDIYFETFRTSILTQLCEDIPAFDLDKFFCDPQGLDVETQQLEEVFQDGGYYFGYPLPRHVDFRKIAELKFLTYARQGLALREWFPNGVLVQNEFPLSLRSRMVNLINDVNNTPLPVIYPYAQRTRRS